MPSADQVPIKSPHLIMHWRIWASRYHGKAPDELDWTEKQRRKRAVAEYLAALEAEAEAVADGDARNDNESGGPEGKRQRRYERQPPKVISPSDPQSNACSTVKVGEAKAPTGAVTISAAQRAADPRANAAESFLTGNHSPVFGTVFSV